MARARLPFANMAKGVVNVKTAYEILLATSGSIYPPSPVARPTVILSISSRPLQTGLASSHYRRRMLNLSFSSSRT